MVTMEMPDKDRPGVTGYLHMEMREVTAGEGPVRLVGTARSTPAVRDATGRMSMGILGAMCDAIGGFCGGLGALPDGWVVTTNMMLRAANRPVGASVALESEVLRAGKSAVVTSVRGTDDDGFVVGGIVRSAVLVPEGGPPQWTRPAVLDFSDRPEAGVPFEEWLAPRPTDDGIEIELRDEFRNPWGIMHGGVTSAVVDAAARAVAYASFDTRIARSNDARHVDDMVLHFVAPARVGPVVASATVLGDRPDGALLRVEVRDQGIDRLAAFAVVTVSGRER